MTINLVLATGVAYAFIGAFIMFLSHRALYRKATHIVAGYPKVLAALRAQRHDGRFGLTVLLCGNALQLLAASGYTLPLAHWRFPVYAIAAIVLAFCLWRVLSSLLVGAELQGSRQPRRTPVRRVYETRRSMVLLEAARREAANRLARELDKGPRDRSVVYLGHEWECRWWSDRFGVSIDTLRDAVRQVGPMVKDVERFFLRSRRGYALAA